MNDIDQDSYEWIIHDYKAFGEGIAWTMKDGTDIFVKDMKESHIINSMNMLKRKAFNGTRKAWIEVFEDVLLRKRAKKVVKLIDNINDKKLF